GHVGLDRLEGRDGFLLVGELERRPAPVEGAAELGGATRRRGRRGAAARGGAAARRGARAESERQCDDGNPRRRDLLSVSKLHIFSTPFSGRNERSLERPVCL